MTLLQALTALFAATLVAAQTPTLFVVFPNLMRFDLPEKVIIDHGGGGGPIPCSLYLQNYPDREKNFSNVRVLVAPGTQQIAYVMTKLTDLPHSSYSTINYVYVRVQCASVGFNKEAVVLVTGTKGYLLLQTDKPIYKPNEEVSIRAVSLNPDLLPTNTEFFMDVLDPNQTIFKRFEGQASKGFFSKKVRLPDVTILGNWSVRASYKNKFQPQVLTSVVSFEVKNYVLPTFSVALKTPDFILRSDREVKISVKARYLHSEDVKGLLKVVFRLVKKDGSSYTVANRSYPDFDGGKTVVLHKGDFMDKWFPDVGSRLVVEAAVTEAASRKQASTSDSSAMFVNTPYMISFDRTAKYFKPGLPYNLKVTLIKYASFEVAGDVSIEVAATARERGSQYRVKIFRNDDFNQMLKTEEEGWKTITFGLPANAEYLRIWVKTADPNISATEQATGEITLQPQMTARNNFLSIQLMNVDSIFPVKKKLGIRVDFTENVDKHVTFLVVTRGKVVSIFSKAVNGLSTFETIDITKQMAPQARLVVYYVSSGNPVEMIADSLVLDVSQTCEDELQLSLARDDGQVYQPSENVELTVKSALDSWVSILGVDMSVYSLGNRNVLSRHKVFQKIMAMDLGCGAGSGRNAGEVLRDAGINVLTNKVDLAIPRRLSPVCEQNIRKRREVGRARRGAKDSNSSFGGLGAGSGEDVIEEDINILIRDDFRETWINELFDMRADSFTMMRQLPDSVTTWLITGVSVSESAGMCVAKPLKVTTKKMSFVHVDLPSVAVRGELLDVNATVHNHHMYRVTVQIWMEGDPSKLCYVGNNGRTDKQRIELEPMASKNVTFSVIPLQVGDIEIAVTATSQFTGDKVIRKLKTVAEGVTRYVSLSTRLDPEDIMRETPSRDDAAIKVDIEAPNQRQRIEIPLKLPADAIPGTEVCSVAITGFPLGPAVPLQDLNIVQNIRQPYGSGEETMMQLAKLVYTADYMHITKTLVGMLMHTAYDNIRHGFLRQLSYKHPDGSYAAFQSYGSSAWLTAFVAKVFCKLHWFPHISHRVLPHVTAAINWLLAHAQRADGSFFETGRVLHINMVGQNLYSSVTFTAFVVEVISKCGNLYGISTTSGYIANKLRMAVDFLVRNKDSQYRPYDQAILTYALALRNNEHRFAANRKLRRMSSIDPATGMRYWNPDGSVDLENTTPAWYNARPSENAIETASYALLSQLAIGTESEDYFQYAGPIASWLILQRRKAGAFVSVTDTVIGLEALSEYASRARYRNHLNMVVRMLSENGTDLVFQLNKANQPHTITENLPIGGVLFIEANGTGTGQVRVLCQYNSPERRRKVDSQNYSRSNHNEAANPRVTAICEINAEGRTVCQCVALNCADFWGFRNGTRPHLKGSRDLLTDACNTHDYAVKVRAGPTEVSGALSSMEATVEVNIKPRSKSYSIGDKIHFVWNVNCENPSFTAGTSYLVMGKYGPEYVDQTGHAAMRYVIDSTSHVVEWYGASQPSYHQVLNTFASQLILDGCAP